MKFKPGQSGNPKGRKPGVKNVKTLQWEKLSDYIIKNGSERIISIMEASNDEDFFDQYVKLISYFKPKMKSLDIESTEKDFVNIDVIEWVGTKEWVGTETNEEQAEKSD